MNWNICQVLVSEQFPDLMQYAVVILNRPLPDNVQYMMNLWNNATIRVTVDGGTKQWDNYCESNGQSPRLPDMVTGDLDSISEEILHKYKAKGCKTIYTPDQDYTDFTKSLIELNNHCKDNDITLNTIIVMGQTSGRIDQIMGNFETLFICKTKQILQPHIKIYILSNDSISWLLWPGEHSIDIPEEIRNNKKPWCSLVPIGKKCESITTTGLKWNLSDNILEFGKLVSTSNTYDGSPTVTVSCTHTILWSMKLPLLREK